MPMNAAWPKETWPMTPVIRFSVSASAEYMTHSVAIRMTYSFFRYTGSRRNASASTARIAMRIQALRLKRVFSTKFFII